MTNVTPLEDPRMLLLFTISDASKTLIVAIVGIVVSGLLGPAATSWATRKANKQQFERDQKAKRRDDLRTVVDDAALLLGAGVTNLRRAREEKAAGRDEPSEVTEWASQVHLLRQRLLLRRKPNDAVVISYGAVLDALNEVGGAASDERYAAAVESYKQRMDQFLADARKALDAPVA